MKVVLTSDEVTFYYSPPLPLRLKTERVRAKYPLYSLVKVSSVTGWEIVDPWRAVELARSGEVDAVGIYVNDPLGVSPVSKSLGLLFGEEPGHVYALRTLLNRLRESGVKIFAGGPGAWQLSGVTVVTGDAENFPDLDLKGNYVDLGEAKGFVPVRSPSGMGEVEVERRGRAVPREVVVKEMEIQARAHGYVNLISRDLFSLPDLYDLLVVASKYGEVRFSNVDITSVAVIDLRKVREVLGLSENRFAFPVLIKGGSCGVDEPEILRELNREFIYPVVHVKEGEIDEFTKYRCIIIPMFEERPYEALYKAWRHNRRFVKSGLAREVDEIVRKNYEMRGELLRKTRGNGDAVAIAVNPVLSLFWGI